MATIDPFRVLSYGHAVFDGNLLPFREIALGTRGILRIPSGILVPKPEDDFIFWQCPREKIYTLGVGITQQVIFRINGSDPEEDMLNPRPMLRVGPLEDFNDHFIVVLQVHPKLREGSGVILH